MNKVIIILGPTGVGKTEASILFAKSIDAEIISADSMQIYKFMNIGTAKPTPEQLKKVKHHMIDIVNPWESFSTGRYISMVKETIKDIHNRGKIPVVTGGTGLYIKAMTRGIFTGPHADWELRERLISIEKEKEGTLYNYLRKLDPETSSKISPNDLRRIIRALEVCIKTNTPISELQKSLTIPLPYEFIKIGLSRERRELYKLIEQRVDLMIEKGLVEEVKNILKMKPDKTPLQAIGYKEIIKYLNNEISLPEAIKLIKRNTKRYAKRQFTWFKKETDILWIDITGIYDSNVITSLIYNLYIRLIKDSEK